MAGIKAIFCSVSPDHLAPFLQELPLALWARSVLFLSAQQPTSCLPAYGRLLTLSDGLANIIQFNTSEEPAPLTHMGFVQQ